MERGVIVNSDYLRTLEIKAEALKVVTEVSALLSSTLDFKELMTLVMERAKQEMDAEACSILFYDKETNKLNFEIALSSEESTSDTLKKKITLELGQGIAGWVAEKQEPLVVDDVRQDSRFYQDADKLTGFRTRNLIAVPLIGRSGLIGVAEVINPVRKDYDLEIFQILCKQFAISIENALYHRESLEREKLKQELEIAASLQKSFLPASPTLKKGNVLVSALTTPAAKVGGDIYDFTEPAEGKAGVLIGDVSGKGISAALYMAKIISDFRYISRGDEAPDDTFDRLNDLLHDAPRGMFLTATYLIIDTETGATRIAVAGHPPFVWLTKGEVRVMNVPSGPPLGIVSTKYPCTDISLGHGDRLFLLTDGLFEAKNALGQRIGFHAIVDFIKNNSEREDLVQALVDHVDDFSKGMERADDTTIVEIRMKGVL